MMTYYSEYIQPTADIIGFQTKKSRVMNPATECEQCRANVKLRGIVNLMSC